MTEKQREKLKILFFDYSKKLVEVTLQSNKPYYEITADVKKCYEQYEKKLIKLLKL